MISCPDSSIVTCPSSQYVVGGMGTRGYRNCFETSLPSLSQLIAHVVLSMSSIFDNVARVVSALVNDVRSMCCPHRMANVDFDPRELQGRFAYAMLKASFRGTENERMCELTLSITRRDERLCK